MSLLDHFSLDHRSLLPVAIAATSATWALSHTSSSVSASTPFYSLNTTPLILAIALCSLAFAYIYRCHLFHIPTSSLPPIRLSYKDTLNSTNSSSNNSNSGSSSSSCNSASSSDCHNLTPITALPQFISLGGLGKVISGSLSSPVKPLPGAVTDGSFLTANPSQEPSVSSSPTSSLEHNESQQHRNQQVDALGMQPRIDSSLKNNDNDNSWKQQSISAAQNVQLGSFEAIPKETLETIRTLPDYRIWDHIIVGDGYDTFQHAYQFALHYPTRTVLVLLSDNIRPTFRTRIMQWMHKILTAQMQQLWSREALKAVPASLRGLSTSSSLPVGSTLPRRPIDFTLDKARPLDLSLLPPNLCIGSKICAAKLLIDKPFNTQSIAASVTNSCTNTPPSAPPRPGPFKRFSSTAGSNLTINTMPLMPPRIVGLEVVASGGPQDKRCRVLCNDSVVFASDKHPLLSSANAMIFTINTTPPTSRDTGVTGHSALLLDTESRLQWPSMIFSITMQHRRQQQDPKLILIHSSSSSIQYRILKAALCFLERISGVRAAYSTQHSFPEKGVNLQPVLLHCSDRVIQNGRVNIREQGDVNSDEVLRLQISASTISLEPSAPIQIEVKVVTQPMQQDAFGNTEMIRKGESVLMEGLGLARQMAKTAGWTCLAEDDSQMVEWVRDQMDIQWSTETASSFSSSNAFILRPLSISLNGLNTFVRSRTASSASSTRTRPSSLSPYASRTQSYKIKRREELGPGMGDKRDSTLERLQKVSANLQTTTQGKEKLDETHLKAPKATIAATKGSLSTSSSPPQRPGLKTSFGGFSSLNDTRMQTLALAEQTEDHLGMALSSGATNSPKKRSSADQNSDSGNGPFSESVAPLDLLGAENQKPVSPTPHKWSRFSIKSYQLERSNYGLSNEWAIGSEGLDMSLSSVPSVSTAVGAILSSSPTSTLISASSSGELISSLPLSSEGGFLGTVSPQTPTPDNLPMTDLLKNMDVSSPPSISPSPSRPKLFDRNTNYNKQSGSADDKGIDDQLSSGKLGSSSLIDSNSRKGGTFTSRCGGGGVTSFGKGGSHHPSPLTTPVELVHDFLGESFTSSTSISKPALFSRPLSRNDLALTMERVQSAPTVPKSSSSLSSSSTTKTVNFADIEQQEQQKDDRLLRAHSDPIVRTTTLCLDDSLSLESDKTHSPLYSMQSSFSKSKAHTRRSWGQGIGGYDIQGLQGLS